MFSPYYEDVEFPVYKKSYQKVETKNYITIINVFGYKNKRVYSIYLSKEDFENHMKLLWIEFTSNSLIALCIIKQNIKLKNLFAWATHDTLTAKKY